MKKLLSLLLLNVLTFTVFGQTSFIEPVKVDSTLTPFVNTTELKVLVDSFQKNVVRYDATHDDQYRQRANYWYRRQKELQEKIGTLHYLMND